MFKTQHLKQKCFYAFLVFTLSIFSLVNGHAKSNATGTDNTAHFVGAPNVLIAQHPKLGAILTDSLGRTLYFFMRDAKKDTSFCVTASCSATWPSFYNANIALGNGLSAVDFGVITRSDGKKQTTYKGWPLYYNVNDAAPGDIKGENFATLWYTAKPDYVVMAMENTLKGLDGVTYTSKYVPGVERVKYFVDAYGRTLYTFSRDSLYKNKFSNATFSNTTWLIYSDSVNAKVPTLVGDTLFKVINVFGRKQLTYKGWPLYIYSRDTLRGQTRGVNFAAPGRWPVSAVALGFAPAPPKVLLAQHPKLGAILTDSLGRTLYFFIRDAKKDTSFCVTASCTATWPPFYKDNITIANGLLASDFGTILRSDGKKQTTYKGWPLYYNVNDAAPGDIKGENFATLWYTAKPDYAVMAMDNTLKGLDGVTYTSKYVPGVERVKYFVDAYGRTLYTFSRDSLYKNKFSNATFSNTTWLIYADSAHAKIPTLVGDTLFKVINVFGRKQLTYKGWPLYIYSRDTLRGQTRGVNFAAPGRWPVSAVALGFAPAPPKVLLAQHPTLGAILTDSLGRTLYLFTRDAKKDTSFCVTASCTATWPPFYKDNITFANGLFASDFGTILRSDGKKQTTYKGWPLYYNVNDAAPGDIKGENFGTVWYTAKPDYAVLTMENNLKGLDGITYTSKYVPGVERVKYFVDPYGRTLYFNSRDSLYKNKFTTANFSNNATWPIYPDTLGKKFVSFVSDTLFKVINVFGRTQLTYKGWPLYNFGRDSLRGQTRGVSFAFPGRWPVAIPTIALAPTTAVTEVFRDKLSLVLSPNPTADYLQISLDSNISGDAVGTLYNLNGQVMQRIYFPLYQGNNQTRLDMSSLSSGLYFMALQINGQPAAYEKIIKQ